MDLETTMFSLDKKAESQKPKGLILRAWSSETFERGQREYGVMIVLDDHDNKPVEAWYPMKIHNIGDVFLPFRFTTDSEAADCASWLIGRQYTLKPREQVFPKL